MKAEYQIQVSEDASDSTELEQEVQRTGEERNISVPRKKFQFLIY
jgi:hypothetical protein